GKLAVHDFEHAIHAVLAECRQPPHVRTANADSRRAQGERLQDVGSTAYAPVDEHRDAVAHRIHDFDEHADRRLTALFRATAVVGDDEAVHAVAQRLLGVLVGHDAFQQELALDDPAQAIDEIPGHAGAVEVGDLRDIDAEEVGFAADLVGECAR